MYECVSTRKRRVLVMMAKKIIKVGNIWCAPCFFIVVVVAYFPLACLSFILCVYAYLYVSWLCSGP